MTDDASLLANYARTRSEEAFAEIVRRHLTLVYSAALRRTGGDLHRAKDVAQIVFTALARDALPLSRHAALTGWLYTATRNAAIDLMRTERRRQQREEKAHTMEEILSSPESLPDWERLRPVLDDAMDELDARDREAVLLRFFEGESFAAVGTKLRVNEDAARKRVDRALDKLGALLSRRGITSTSGALALLLANQVAVAAPASVATSVTTAALAGAGVAGVGVAGIFIMTTSKLVTGIAAIVAGVAIGSAIYQAKLSREATAITVEVANERDGLRARLAAAEKRVQQTDDALAAKQKELENSRASTASAPAVPLTPPPASQSGVAMDYVLEHPETHAAFLRQQELRLKTRYDRFLKTAQLSDEQKQGFLKEMNEAMASELDLMAVLHSHGYGVGNLPKDPQAQAQFQQLLKENRENTQAIATKIRTVLGEEQFKQFQSYASTIPERNVTDQMAAQLYLTDAPLTGPQAEQIARILAQNRFAPQAEASPTTTLNGTFVTPQMFSGRIGQAMQQGGMNLLDWPAPVTDAALAKAEAVLTPGQFAALKQIQVHQLTQFQLAPPPPSPVKTPANDK